MLDNTKEQRNIQKNYSKPIMSILKDKAYNYNQTIFKIYGYGNNKKIKLINMNYLKNSGIEIDDVSYMRGTVNSSKLEESIIRTKNKIFELAFCNPWDWFFTGTLNPNKQDRTDLELYHKQLTQWIRNYNRINNTNIKFLLVPELHKDGKSWHVHGLLYGLPKEHLKQFKIGDNMGKGLADKVIKGDVVYNWLPYFNRFGFCDLEPIQNHEAISKYITKYINKDLANSVTELDAHKYYHSRGLKFAEVIKKGSMNWADIEPTYKNDYCCVAWLDYDDKTFNELLNKFI